MFSQQSRSGAMSEPYSHARLSQTHKDHFKWASWQGSRPSSRAVVVGVGVVVVAVLVTVVEVKVLGCCACFCSTGCAFSSSNNSGDTI